MTINFDHHKVELNWGGQPLTLEVPPGTIVYVDPLAPFLGGNLNDYDACATACVKLRPAMCS